MPLDIFEKPVAVENFIGGSFVKASQYLDSFNPSTGEAWASVPDSSAEDVNAAVRAAKNAFPMYLSRKYFVSACSSLLIFVCL